MARDDTKSYPAVLMPDGSDGVDIWMVAVVNGGDGLVLVADLRRLSWYAGLGEVLPRGDRLPTRSRRPALHIPVISPLLVLHAALLTSPRTHIRGVVLLIHTGLLGRFLFVKRYTGRHPVGMTIATWILAIATVALAIEGGAALRGWFAHLQLGRRKRELAEIRRDVAVVQHAVWMDVATAGQGSRSQVDEKVRRMLQLDGWTPDVALMEQAGYFDMGRLYGQVPGVTDE